MNPSLEVRQHLSLAHIGYRPLPEACAKLSMANKGHGVSDDVRAKISAALMGHLDSEETRAKIGAKSKERIGPLAARWEGGLTPINAVIRHSDEYNAWRTAVFERDHYTCQECGDSMGGNLNAHHSKPFSQYPELRLDVDNGVTLCEKCHRKRGRHLGIQHSRLRVAATGGQT
jgi:5-methylcytosine-specific restriction endonuclease McrA